MIGNSASESLSSSLQAFNSLLDKRSGPGALFGGTIEIAALTSLVSTSQLIFTVSLNVVGSISRLGIRERSAFGSGKKRSDSTLAFCSCEMASCGPSGVLRRGGMAGGSGFLWLRSLAHLSRSQN